MSSKIREKLIDHMEFNGLSKETQRSYINGVKGLVKHYYQSPEKLTDDQIRAYFHPFSQSENWSGHPAKATRAGSPISTGISVTGKLTTAMVCRPVREGESCPVSSAWKRSHIFFPVSTILNIRFCSKQSTVPACESEKRCA